MKKPTHLLGFTLIEIIVVISIIGLLSMVGYASFADARAEARDKTRLASLQQLQLALELYKANDPQNEYPEAGCTRGTDWVGPGTHEAALANTNDCADYIVGLVPDFMPALPRDPKDEMIRNKGFLYKVSADRRSYKVLVHDVVESAVVSNYNNEFARCPRDYDVSHCDAAPQSATYAIYSAGAENW